MMLLGRGWVAVGLGLALVLSAGHAPGQASKRPRGHVVQPKDGPPPEQAQQPDPPAQYEHAADPEQPPEPELPPEPEQTQAVPDPPAAEQAAQPLAPQPEPALPSDPPPTAAAAVEQAPPPVALAQTGPQNELQKDTTALLQLALDLKTELEKAGSNTLSLVAIRKADEIQKLSRNLKERLRDQGQLPVTK